jgi:hypothetical protein
VLLEGQVRDVGHVIICSCRTLFQGLRSPLHYPLDLLASVRCGAPTPHHFFALCVKHAVPCCACHAPENTTLNPGRAALGS